MRILNWIVTNKYTVWFSYWLCRLWNAVALHTPGARRRGEHNRAALAAFTSDGRINGQKCKPVARLPYGKFTMDYNGCEVIAAYNALLALGMPAALPDAAGYFERHGIFLDGAWGTHVLAIPGFFKTLGLSARAHWSDFDEAFSGAQAAVFSFWNNAKRLRDGVHTVALSRGPDGGLVIDNLYTADPRPSTGYRTIAEMTGRTGILPLLLVTVERT